METLFTKRIIIIFSVILAIAVGAVILGFSLNNTHIPTIENGDEIVYERHDENGDVIYTITKQELYEEMKNNNGLNQILSMFDEEILSDYIDGISQAEVDERIQLLKYQTNDQDVIDNLDPERKEELEINYERLITLSGYHNSLDQEENFAKLLIAREKFVADLIMENGDITENEVADYYLNSYFEDVKAIRLRFLSKADAENVLNHFYLGEVAGSLALYLGYTYEDEDLLDGDDNIVEAIITVDVYYFDEEQNILDINEDIIYEYDNGTYTDDDDDTYTLDGDGNLVNDSEEIVIEAAHIFTSLEDAQTFKDDNTTYFTTVKNDTIVEVYDLDDTLTYKYDTEEDILYDASDVEVEVDLHFNKNFTDIADVDDFTENNTTPLTDEEVLSYYIKMYNHLYGEYRDTLDENATLEDLLALDNENLVFNFEEVNEINSTLSKYIFTDISQLNDTVYASTPKNIGDYSYMVYKLDEADKVDLKSIVMDAIKETIVLPSKTNEDIILPTEGPYNSTITWRSSETDVISNTGQVILPDEDTIVEMSYTIKTIGATETGKIVVRVMVSEEVDETIEEVTTEDLPSLKDLIDDDTLYNEIEEIILEEKVESNATIDQYFNDYRDTHNFELYDYYLALDYKKDYDSEYEFDNKGDKKVIAKIDLEDGSTFELTADEFYEKSLMRNPSLMIFYASQTKEAIHSDYFKSLFGSETNLDRNDTELMEQLKDGLTNIRNQYNQLLQLRDQQPQQFQYYLYMYQMSNVNFDSYGAYLYTRWNITSESQLLSNLVMSELQLSYAKDTLDQADIIDEIYDIAMENYNNFFSLKAEHILIFFDYDEDGQADDYNEYYDGLTETEQDDLDTLVGSLETYIRDSEDTFEDIITEFESAERDDETWGQAKQLGFLLKYESLNPTDRDGNEESITYKSAKDTYVQEFTDALINLYDRYQDPLNVDSDSLYSSSLIETQFGLHLIKAEKGDDFDGISLAIGDDDYTSISDSLLSDTDAPSLEQIETYYTYKVYENYHDLDNVDVESRYGIALPQIPTEVLEDLNFYAEEAFEPLFSSYLINYSYIVNVEEGQVVSQITQTVFEENMEALKEIYAANTLDKILTE
jgi:hypothetical protein